MFAVRNLATIARKTVNSSIGPKVITRLSSAASNIVKSPWKDVPIPEVPLPEFIFSKCEPFEQCVAIECATTGRKYTYGQLITKSRNLAKSLRKKLGLKEKDVVALLLPNLPEYPIAALGVLHGGLIATTINPLYTAQEIARQMANSSAAAVITLVDLAPVVAAAAKALKKQLPVLVIKLQPTESLPEGVLDFQEFTDCNMDYPEQSLCYEDVALLPYSSGTTGLPKGVQLSHYNVVANICQNSSPEVKLLRETTTTCQDVIPVILPMFHIYGLSVNTLWLLANGVKLVTLLKFSPEAYVKMLQQHQPHLLFLVPPIVLFMAAHPMVKSEDFKSVRVVFSGAAPLGALDEERLAEKAGRQIDILQGYGLTETSPTVTVISPDLKHAKNVAGSIGCPVPNTLIKVVPIDESNGGPDEPDDSPLGPNETGELLVKGPQVMKAYLNQPEENKKAFVDGWYKTGDMVCYNEDNFLFITDRLKELIKVKGFQVAPAELEEIIRDIPNVEDAAVIGVSHPIYGEVPRAYVVAKKNTKLNPKDVEEHVKGQVANFKQLTGGVELVEAIPKSPTGKIIRRVLKEQYEEANAKKK